MGKRFSLLSQLVACTILLATAPGLRAANPCDGQKCESGKRASSSSRATSSDRLRLPAAQSQFASSDGRFRFSISTPDGWRSKQGKGRLTRVDASRETVLWEGDLPQEYGPRYVLVGSHGHILLLDEWINVKSRYAVMVLSPGGEIVQHRFDDVQAVLDVPAKTIVRMAKGGWWISAPPTLAAHGYIAEIPTAGKLLRVDLRTGELFL